MSKDKNKSNTIPNNFINNGYIIYKIEDKKSLNYISSFINSIMNKNAKNKIYTQSNLNKAHSIIDKKNLNDFRLQFINAIQKDKKFRDCYYNIAKPMLELLVGNELVMQNSINMSIQLPEDNSSLLGMHADTWSGDSPFEIVVWLPLVDCFKTKSMYIMNAKYYNKFLKQNNFSSQSSVEEIYKKNKKYLSWIDIKFGEVLLFNQNLPHGNIVNKENETRFSLNCRFKSLFSPYGNKKIGDFFSPIELKPMTKIGLEYEEPKK